MGRWLRIDGDRAVAPIRFRRAARSGGAVRHVVGEPTVVLLNPHHRRSSGMRPPTTWRMPPRSSPCHQPLEHGSRMKCWWRNSGAPSYHLRISDSASAIRRAASASSATTRDAWRSRTGPRSGLAFGFRRGMIESHQLQHLQQHAPDPASGSRLHEPCLLGHLGEQLNVWPWKYRLMARNSLSTPPTPRGVGSASCHRLNERLQRNHNHCNDQAAAVMIRKSPHRRSMKTHLGEGVVGQQELDRRNCRRRARSSCGRPPCRH